MIMPAAPVLNGRHRRASVGSLMPDPGGSTMVAARFTPLATD
jgi:hypothetical protein